MAVNDNKYLQYHRNNGITKIGVYDPNKKNEMNYMGYSVEGTLSVADTINQAYIRTLHPDTFIQSGVQFMPFSPNFDLEINRLVNIIGLLVYPFGLCLLLPIIIYSIVIEKEKKLIETMKINGLKMYNYWFITFLFNFGVYMITVIIYYGAGMAMNLDFFKNTNPMIMLLVFIGWGLC
jgi:hypothetical protein